MLKRLLIVSDNSHERKNIARAYWGIFFGLLTIGAISIIMSLLNNTYFDYNNSEKIFLELLFIYFTYLLIGIHIFKNPSQYIYLLLITVLLLPSFLGFYNWGILHPHSILLFTTTLQLTYFLLNRNLRTHFIFFVMSLFLTISILQITQIITYDYITPSLYFHLSDILLITVLIITNLLGINIYYNSTIKNIRKIKKLNTELQNQNLNLKLKLIKELQENFNIKKDFNKRHHLKSNEIEKTYNQILNDIQTNIYLLNSESYHRLTAQDFIHQISNISQKLVFTDTKGISNSLIHKLQTILNQYKQTLTQKTDVETFSLLRLLQKLLQENYYPKKLFNLQILKDCQITGNQEMLKHILLNLIQNSLHAKSTLITIKCTSTRLNTSKSTKPIIKISISDNGKGLTLKQFTQLQNFLQNKTINTYNNTKSKGLGLGLKTSTQIIEKYFNGTLTIKRNKIGLTVELAFKQP